MSHFSLFTIRLKWASIGKRLTRWDSQRAFQSSAQAHLHMACFSLALSILGLACWLWIRKCMWIFTCTSFENESCDFEKIIQSVDGAWPVSTGVRKMPVHSKLITLQMMGSHASKKATRIHAPSAGEGSIRVQITGCISLCGWRDG